jgi:hypothetical protein
MDAPSGVARLLASSGVGATDALESDTLLADVGDGFKIVAPGPRLLSSVGPGLACVSAPGIRLTVESAARGGVSLPLPPGHPVDATSVDARGCCWRASAARPGDPL